MLLWGEDENIAAILILVAYDSAAFQCDRTKQKNEELAACHMTQQAGMLLCVSSQFLSLFLLRKRYQSRAFWVSGCLLC